MMANHPPVSGLLLAAGAGRRMGRAKVLVSTPDGRPWLHLALDTLLAATDDVLVVLGSEAARATELLPDDPRVSWVVAPAWAEGMGASLRCGLQTLLTGSRSMAALVHLVDLPDVCAPVAHAVVRGGGQASLLRTVLRRAAYHGRPGHPVLLGRDHWEPLAASVVGDRGARDYLAGRVVTLVECGRLATGRDRDTPMDQPR